MGDLANLLEKHLRKLAECVDNRSKRIDSGTAADILMAIHQTCSNYPLKESSKSSICAHVFSKMYGVPNFLRSVVLGGTECKTLKSNAFKFLDDFLDLVGSSATLYGPELKDVCVIYMKQDSQAVTKKAALVTLSKVLELCQGSDVGQRMQVKNLVEDLFLQLSLRSKLPATVKENVLCLLGTIAHYYPEDFVSYSDRILMIFLHELQDQMNSKAKKAELNTVTGCLVGLKEYLYNFTVTCAEDPEKSKQVFDCAKRAVKVGNENLAVCRAGLQLLSAHASQFGQYLYECAEDLCTTVSAFLTGQNRDLQKVAYLGMVAFLMEISKILPAKIEEDLLAAKEVFNFFMDEFKKTFIGNSSSRQIAVAVIGYGFFASACKKLINESEVKAMLFKVIQMTEHIFFRTRRDLDEVITQMPSFLDAIANIIREIDLVPNTLMFSLEKLVVFQIDNFPHVPSTFRFLVSQSFVRVLFALQPKADLFKDFLSHIVYQGIVRTCSHSLVAEIEAKKSEQVETTKLFIENPRVKMISYKDYLPLWNEMLNVVLWKEFSWHGVSLSEKQAMREALYNEIITAVLGLFEKLDLSVAAKDSIDVNEVVEAEMEKLITSDPVQNVAANNIDDCRVFVNVVDFCREFLIHKCAELFAKWVYLFAQKTIYCATKYPFISGFYKLIALNLNICSKIGYFKGVTCGDAGQPCSLDEGMEEVNERVLSLQLFAKFSREVLVHMQQFKDDLLASCLLVLLALPSQIVRSEIHALVPALQGALKLGLGYLPLASVGLDTLQQWCEDVPEEIMKQYYPDVLPLLNQYLIASKLRDEGSASVVAKPAKPLYKKSLKMSAKNIKASKASSVEVAEYSELLKIQLKIVHFLGKLGGEHNKAMLEHAFQKADSAAVAWDFDNRNHLKYPVPFPDMKPEIYFDDFLPRVLELATTATERQMKVAACEVLHSLVLYVVGTGSQLPESKRIKTTMEELYKHLMPGILSLACDVDQVTKQLFHPLVIQLTHWFSHHRTIHTPEAQIVLQSLWDGATDSENAALRDFSAVCLKEYFLWALKQSAHDPEKHVKGMFKKIHSFAVHPSVYKRLGAALVFNNIYTVFRNEEKLVKAYTLELLVSFIDSLAISHADDKLLGTQKLCIDAVKHIERILIARSHWFVASDERIRKPHCFAEADLVSTVMWLLRQCGNTQTECRHVCMELVVKLAHVLPGVSTVNKLTENVNVIEEIFERKIKELGVPPVPVQHVSWRTPILWLEALMTSLECYSWAVKVDVITAESSTQLEKCTVLQAAAFFTEKLVTSSLSSALCHFGRDQSADYTFTPREVLDFNWNKCSVLIRLFTLFVTLSERPHSYVNKAFHSDVWNESFWKAILLSAIDPSILGFNVTDAEVSRNLYAELEGVLKVRECQEEPFLTFCAEYLKMNKRYNIEEFFPMDYSKSDVELIKTSELLTGYRLLISSGLWPAGTFCSQGKEKFALDLLNNVWENLIVTQESSDMNCGLSPCAFKLAKEVLCISDSLGISAEDLLLKLMDADPVAEHTESGNQGLIGFVTFETEISKMLCKRIDKAVPLIVSHMELHLVNSLAVLSKLLSVVAATKELRKKYGKSVLTSLLKHWPPLSLCWKRAASPDVLDLVLGIMTNMILIDSEVAVNFSRTYTLSLFETYIELLERRGVGFDFKVRALDLLPFFIDDSEEKSKALRACLNEMIVSHFPVESRELVEGSFQYNCYVSAIKKLLSAFELTGSLMLLEVLTMLFCSEENHAMEDQFQKCLANLAKSLAVHKHQELAEVPFKLTKPESTDLTPKAQFAVMDRVCLPILSSIRLSAFTNFFVSNVGSIMSTLKCRRCYDPNARKVQLIAKIGAFKLMEMLYKRLPKDQVHSVESQVVRSYVEDKPQTGKELTTDLMKVAIEFKKENFGFEGADMRELCYKYCAASFNTLVAVISCTQNELKFYNAFVFKENQLKGERIWENIVSPAVEYKFDVELDLPVKRQKRFVAIRHHVRSSKGSSGSDNVSDENGDGEESKEEESSVHLVASQHLAMSSLAEDVSKFDFSTTEQVFVTRKERISKGPLSTSEEKNKDEYIYMEADELNSHDCMAPMMSLFKHMSAHGLISENERDCPAWLESITSILENPDVHRNVKLFLCRVITNNAEVLKGYGRHLLKALMKLIASGTFGTELNYYILDVIIAMLSWAPDVVPADNPLERYDASTVLEFLITHCGHKRKDIFRNNLEVIKTLLECWKGRIDIPYSAIYQQIRMSDPSSKDSVVGMQVLGVVLMSNLPPYPIEYENDWLSRLDILVFNLKNKYKEVYATASEVIGLVLKYKVENDPSFIHDQYILYKNVSEKLSVMRRDETDKFLTCLHIVHKHHPHIVQQFFGRLLFLQPSVHGLYQNIILEMLCSCVKEVKDGYSQLKTIRLFNELEHKEETVQSILLQTLERVFPDLPCDEVLTLLPLIIPVLQQPAPQCRIVLYRIMMVLYDKYRNVNGPKEQEIVRLSQETLLKGLADPDIALRLTVDNFWSSEQHLPVSTKERLLALMKNMYSPPTEDSFLQYATFLLLERTSHSPDYKRNIFSHPLSECNFLAYNIATSWRQRYAIMTPLFIDSASSSLSSSLSSLGAASLSAAGDNKMMVKATQQKEGDFSATKDSTLRSGTYNWLVDKSIDTFADNPSGDSLSSFSGTSSAGSHILTSKRSSVLPNTRPDTAAVAKDKETKKSGVWMLRRRFIKDRKTESDVFARMEMRRKDAREELQKEQKKRREAEVTMYRQYRIGELPDIEIPNSAVIAPLQALAQNDLTVAKQLFKSLVVSICDHLKTDEPAGCDIFREEVGNCVSNVIQKSTDFVPAVISFCLECLHEIGCIGVDPEHVYVASLHSNQQSIGILLLESQILKSHWSPEPRRKKPRFVKEPTEKCVSEWIKLAGLYKSVDDYDVVNGIFSHVMGSRDANRKVLALEAGGHYAEALKLYSELYDSTSDEDNQAEKDFWDSSILFCYDRLTQWEDLEETAFSRFCDSERPDLQKVWDDPYFVDNYLPYIIRAKVKRLITGHNDQSLLSFVDELKSDDEKRAHIQDHFVNELSLLYVLQENFEAARHYGSNAFIKFLKDWSSLSRLAVNVQQTKLRDLQKCAELEEFLDLTKRESSQSLVSARKVIERWQKRLPSMVDPINVWDDIVTNRQLYLKKLKQIHKGFRTGILSQDSQENSFSTEDAELGHSSEQFYLEQSVLFELSFVKYCTSKGNIPVALRHLKNIRNDVKRLGECHWPEFIEAYCLANNGRASKLDGEEKLGIFLNSCLQIEKVEAKNGLTLSQKILQSEIFELMFEVLSDSEICLSELGDSTRNKVLDLVNGSNDAEVLRGLHSRSFSCLQDAVSSVSSKRGTKHVELICKAQMCLANFCNKYLRLVEAGEVKVLGEDQFSVYPKVMTESLLSALHLGDKQAAQLFPRLLQIIELHPDVLPVFVENASSVPCWMFIAWINQMVALLDKPESLAVQGIVEKIVREYPMAIVYAFGLSCEGYSFTGDSESKKSKAFVERMKKELEQHWLVTNFISALYHLCVPHAVFKDYMVKMLQLLVKPKRDETQILALFKEIWEDLFLLPKSEDRSVPPGPVQAKFAEDFAGEFKKVCGKDGRKLLSASCNTVREAFKNIFMKAKTSYSALKKKGVLKDISPWLSEFQPWKFDTQIEIPGQYTGKSKPLPEYHVKVAGFDEKILILSSITLPCRITVRGNDEKEYKMLVKSGEDLRQDSRLEQLFTVMNEIYSSDPECGSRHYRLATYKVIPISSRLGIIEWVDNTVVLNEFLFNSMTENERKSYTSSTGYMNVCQEKMAKWVKSNKSPTEMYQAMHMKMPREESINKFEEVVSLVPHGLLKRAFLKLSSSPEAFLRIRSRFAASHALICISQWLLGIGDRHLGNFLIDLTTGQEVGIDFGHAFGTATQFLPVPELVPFRLTPQYLQLMEPLKEKGVIEATMAHALTALRKNSNLLLNIMDIFIKEPTVDWMANAEKQKRELGLTDEEAGWDSEWYPKQRVLMASQKLDGANPCHVMKEELELGHGRTEYFEKFKSVCLGDPEHNIRAKLNADGLSPEEQFPEIDLSRGAVASVPLQLNFDGFALRNTSGVAVVMCLIDQATDPHVLCKTYFGWNPWM